MRTLLSADTTGGRWARTRSLWALTGLLLTLTLALGAPRARGQPLAATFPLTPVAESGVSGTAAVAALGDGASLIALAVVGLEPGARYQSMLHAGPCDHPSASFTALVALAADAAGTATAIGPVRFRGVEDIPLSVLTDGHTIIVLAGAEGAVACGSIPARASAAIDRQRFVALATSAPCADRRNQLFVIDDQLVLWRANGTCPDGRYTTQLVGSTPNDLLCSLSASIAGPVRTCVDDSVRPVFATITANDHAPDLGLGPDHQVVLAWSAPPASLARATPAAVPPEVRALLPVGAELRVAVAADLSGRGEPQWALVYDTPTTWTTPDGQALFERHLAIATRGPAGWTVEPIVTVGVIPEEFLDGSIWELEFALRDIAGAPAVVLAFPFALHNARLVVVRWDGTTFVLVFDQHTTNTFRVEPPAFGIRGLALADVNGDGIPEVVQREPSYCVLNFPGPPHLLTVYRWDGATYADATGDYPDLLAEAGAEIQAALADAVAGRTSVGGPSPVSAQVCLHAALAYHAAKAGDVARAAAECARARALDPATLTRFPWIADACG